MPIVFSCPSCGKKLSVAENLAGRTAKCPCGSPIKVPSPAGQPAQGSAQPAQGSAQPAQAQPAMAQPGQPQPGQLPAQQSMPGQAAPQPNAGVPHMDPGMLNPDFQIQCLQCGTQYPIRPDLLGQTVACQCGAPIRFEDPLGMGGSMVADPLKPKNAVNNNQPEAYQSLSSPGDAQKSSRQKEHDVLKMYIKDEEEFEKATKAKPKRKDNVLGVDDNEPLSMGKVISAISILAVGIGLAIGMLVVPDAMGETTFSEAMDDGGIKGVILKALWCMPTGIVLASLCGITIILGCIMPKRVLLFLGSSGDDEDEE